MKKLYLKTICFPVLADEVIRPVLAVIKKCTSFNFSTENHNSQIRIGNKKRMVKTYNYVL